MSSVKNDESVPLVTIGITCYNAEDTISRAIESALAQDWPSIEIIIVDDVSTDNSLSVLRQYSERYNRVRLVEHTVNQGPAGARNSVLNEARGEFIAFYDDDDEAFSNRITEQVNTLCSFEKQKERSLVACYASGVRHYPNGYSLSKPAIGSRGSELPNGTGVAAYLLCYERREDWFYGAGTPTCSLLARKSTFNHLEGFDASLRRVEDVDFAIRLALAGGWFIGTQLELFAQFSTNAPDKSPERNLKAEQYLAIKHENFLRSINRAYYALNWPKLRYCHFKKNYWNFAVTLIGLLIHNPIATVHHLLATGPKRLLHEHRMKTGRNICG